MVRFYRPQSELRVHQGTLEAYFREHPPASVKQAMATTYHLSQISPHKERGQGETPLRQVEQLSQSAREPGHTRPVGLANAPVVGVGLLLRFFSVGVGD
jgi:hypothetical protein